MADYLAIARRTMKRLQEEKAQAPPIVPDVMTSSLPLVPGDLIAWRDACGQLQGGDESRAKGEIRDVLVSAAGFVFVLADGSHVQESRIVSAARVRHGEVVAAWSTRRWGITGEGERR